MNATTTNQTADAAVPAAVPTPMDTFLLTLPDRELIACLRDMLERLHELPMRRVVREDEIRTGLVMANELARRLGAA